MAIDVIVASEKASAVRYDSAVGLACPDSGALVLLNKRSTPIAAYAPGTWFMAEEAGCGTSADPVEP